MSALEVIVLATPAPQGSKRHVGRGVLVESSAAVKPWRAEVVAEALEAREAVEHATLVDPVVVYLDFYMRRPRAHFRTGANAHLLRDSAPARPGTKPDLDKLVRSTLDALTTAEVYRDDAQIVRLVASKHYADRRPVGAAIRVARWEP